MSTKSKLIVGTALGIATIAAAVDHTRYRVPAPVAVVEQGQPAFEVNPCSLDVSPCSLDSSISPCSL